MLNLALVGDKDGDLYPDDDAASEKDIITLQQKGDSDEDDDDDDDEDELETDEESSVTGPEPSTSACRPAKKERTPTVRTCLQSKPCTICVYLCLALLILASLVALVVIGVLIVAPYRRVTAFEETFCKALDSTEDPSEPRCSCGKGCNSKYPCINVFVSLSGGDNVSRVKLYENEATLSRQVRSLGTFLWEMFTLSRRLPWEKTYFWSAYLE